MTNVAKALPEHVVRAISSAANAEFATVNRAGAPIDTPLLSFPDRDLSKITMATGLAYPVKADRARRNPKVGLLYPAMRPGDPVVQVIGRAAVRDSDIQANLLHYMAETIHLTDDAPWEAKQKAIWYWARILIEIHPKQILWWDEAALDRAPGCWNAPADTAYPASDPAPSGKPTPAPKWPQPHWTEAARPNVDAGYPAFVSVMDDGGYPRIMPAIDVRMTDKGLSFGLPAGMPGERSGDACLTYFGRDTFIGTIAEAGGRAELTVDRALPILPLLEGDLLWHPTAEIKAQLMGRLEAELARRGQDLPAIPREQPASSADALERQGSAADERMFESNRN